MSNHNLSPVKILVRGAIITSLSTWFFCFLIVALVPNLALIQFIWIVPLVVFPISFFVYRELFHTFIISRVNLLYKIIQRQKRGKEKNQLKFSKNDDAFSIVEKDIELWSVQENQEKAYFNQLEEYRRNFMGNVSHELKTPIFNMQGLLYTLMDGAHEDPAMRLDYLKRATKNAVRLQTIVEDLEAITRMESGNWVLDFKPFDINQLVNEVIDELQPKAKAKRLKLVLKDNVALSAKALGDEEQIRQVLINLIDNSIKYGKEGGSTKINIYNVDKQYLIEVSDNGIGISPEHAKHVFDRFYRVDKGRSREQGGSGLGLSIVKHIIDAHQQTIHLRSSPGVGSTFGFTLKSA